MRGVDTFESFKEVEKLGMSRALEEQHRRKSLEISNNLTMNPNEKEKELKNKFCGAHAMQLQLGLLEKDSFNSNHEHFYFHDCLLNKNSCFVTEDFLFRLDFDRLLLHV